MCPCSADLLMLWVLASDSFSGCLCDMGYGKNYGACQHHLVSDRERRKERPGLLSKGWGYAQVRQLALVLLAFRLGVLPAEQAAPLKLLEKGVSKEALAGLVRLPF